MNKLRARRENHYLAIFFMILYVLLSANPCFAEKVRVGIFDGSSYYNVDEDGKNYGYGYEILDSIARYTGFQYEYVYGSWSECLARLESGDIDMLDTVVQIPARQRVFDFCEYSTGISFCKVFVRANEFQYQRYNDFKFLYHKKIGILKGNVQNDIFKEYMENAGIDVTFVDYPREDIMSAALNNGEIDAVVASNMRLDNKERPIGRIAPRNFYIATTKEKPDLMKKINEGVAQLLVENPNFISELSRKYGMYDLSVMVFSEEELNFIKNANPITVVHDSYWPPFESISHETGEVLGINVDILRIISANTGLRFEFISGYTYEQCIEMVGKGEADMLLSYDTNANMARTLNFVLSDTFLSTPISVIGIKQAIDDKSVFAVSRMLPLVEKYVREIFPKNKILFYDDIEECYAAVGRGEAQFTLENTYAANEVIHSGKYQGLGITMVTTLMDNFSFAFRVGINKNIVNIFNKAIRTISQGERERILFQYSGGRDTSVPFLVFYETYKTYIWIGMAFVMFFFAFIQMKGKRDLWKAAYIDSLTGVSNLTKFIIDAERILNSNPDTQFVILKLDIEHFKFYNEIYGSEGGDQILQSVAKSLHEVINSKYETFARIGSDEFILLLMCQDSNELMKKKLIFEDHFYNIYGLGNLSQVKFPTGRYFIEKGEKNVREIFEKVNYAHRLAKKLQGRLVYDYDENSKKSALRLHEIENKMEDALVAGEFLMFLQPKYAISDESIAGAEALVRWQDGYGKDLVYPDSFIPLFEQNGFIIKLDLYMLDKVCRTIRYWIDNDIPPTNVSVNFSRLHLVKHPSFVEDICVVIDRYNVPRGLIEIEFTESTMFGSEAEFMEMLEKLHKAGLTLSMDDFGTGYSSLGLLKNIPVDVVKMDKSFFTSSDDIERTKIIVSNIMTMAHELNIKTVAEGVETFEQVELLRDVGCDIIQGYYYSKPLNEKAFTKEMKSSSKRSFLKIKNV